eukprot:GHVT01060659.1.p1 GENE.GHVT01060659.1~~GHVT01060659.1.p1  ORF type:complete len:157 (-),score=1.61 GHVT01060659.1:120-590(-)
MFCSQLQGSKANPWQIGSKNSLRGKAVGESPGFSKQYGDVTEDYISGKYVHEKPMWVARDPVRSLSAELDTCWRSCSTSFRPHDENIRQRKAVCQQLKEFIRDIIQERDKFRVPKVNRHSIQQRNETTTRFWRTSLGGVGSCSTGTKRTPVKKKWR